MPGVWWWYLTSHPHSGIRHHGQLFEERLGFGWGNKLWGRPSPFPTKNAMSSLHVPQDNYHHTSLGLHICLAFFRATPVWGASKISQQKSGVWVMTLILGKNCWMIPMPWWSPCWTLPGDLWVVASARGDSWDTNSKASSRWRRLEIPQMCQKCQDPWEFCWANLCGIRNSQKGSLTFLVMESKSTNLGCLKKTSVWLIDFGGTAGTQALPCVFLHSTKMEHGQVVWWLYQSKLPDIHYPTKTEHLGDESWKPWDFSGTHRVHLPRLRDWRAS